MGSGAWWTEFFDELYFELYSSFQTEDRNRAEAELAARILNLSRGSRLLDLGCGFARLATHLASMGVEVLCLDFSSKLLEIGLRRAREFGADSAIHMLRGDMRLPSLRSSSVDAAMIWFTTFGFFSDEENERVLDELSRVVKPGGRVAIDVFNSVRALHTIIRCDAEGKKPGLSGWSEHGRYLVLESIEFDLLSMRSRSKRIIIDRESGKRIAEKPIDLRMYMPHELIKMLESRGFRVRELLGNYRGEPYKPLSPRLIIVAEKIP